MAERAMAFGHIEIALDVIDEVAVISRHGKPVPAPSPTILIHLLFGSQSILEFLFP